MHRPVPPGRHHPDLHHPRHLDREATAKVQKLRIDKMTPGLYRITQVTEREPECTCATPGFGGQCAGEPWCLKVEGAAAAQPVPE